MLQIILDYHIISVFIAVLGGTFFVWFERHAGKLNMSDKELIERYLELVKRNNRRK